MYMPAPSPLLLDASGSEEAGAVKWWVFSLVCLYNPILPRIPQALVLITEE